jgi:DNA mismatch repair protein MutS
VMVQEVGDKILFLHRLRAGGADRSYGIEVGRLAGLPASVIARARALLAVLEAEHLVPALAGNAANAHANAGAPASNGARTRATHAVDAAPAPDQLALFGPATPDPLVERLRAIDADSLTPLQALTLLAELSAKARQGA